MRRRGIAMEADILVYRSNMSDLPEMVRVYTGLGVARGTTSGCSRR